MRSRNIPTAVALLAIALIASACDKNRTGRGPEIGGADRGCYVYTTKDDDFSYVSQQAKVETQWHEEWTSRHGETLPDALSAPEIWLHPKLSKRYAATMHENSSATDVSVEPGPIPANPRVEYFHVLEKGARLSGMSPFYTFLDDQTVVTISFGRDAATLLVIDISDQARVLDHVAIPGRGSTALELVSKRARLEIFRDTSGGAYSYLDSRGNVYVPGADDTLIGIPIRNRKIDRERMILVDLAPEVAQGTWVSDTMDRKDNVLTALMPDAQGKVWFTSKYGIIGVIDVDYSGNCPRVYTTAVSYFALRQKLEQHLGEHVVGHAEVMTRVSDALRKGAAGFHGHRPLATFLFLGPTGVGKTETARALNEVFFMGCPMTRIDMSELSESHAVAKLVGAPPGYIGHDTGGLLTESIRHRPYQLVLLDEIEKAHMDVLQSLLPLLEDGRLTDGKGRTVDCTHTIVVMTSNLGAQQSGRTQSSIGFQGGSAGSDPGFSAALAAARRALPPELWNRIDEPLFFGPLSRDEVSEIARRMVAGVVRQLRERQGVELSVDATAIDSLVALGGYDAELGARPMRRAIGRMLEAPLAAAILGSDFERGDRILAVGDSEGICFKPLEGSVEAAE
ncbi:MAG: AAA family ATPase [Deltaproteobacteria bacterium]